MIYRSLFNRALKIASHHILLWAFGAVVATLLFMEEFRPLISFFREVGSNYNFTEVWVYNDWVISALRELYSILVNNPVSTVLWSLAVIIVTVFIGWIVIFCHGVLISLIDQYNNDKNIDILKALSVGFKRSINNIAIHIVGKIFTWISVLIVAFPTLFLAMASSADQSELMVASGIFVLFALVVYIPVAISVNFIKNYAVCYSTIYNYNWLQSLKASIKITRRHWLESLEWGIILLIIDIVSLGIFMFIARAFLSFDSNFPVLLVYLGTFWTYLIGIFCLFCLMLYFGFITSLRQAMWVLLFERFTMTTPASIISAIVRYSKKAIDIFHDLSNSAGDIKDEQK